LYGILLDRILFKFRNYTNTMRNVLNKIIDLYSEKFNFMIVIHCTDFMVLH